MVLVQENLITETTNIKIYVSLTKFLKNYEYHSKIVAVLKPLREVTAILDSLNIQDDSPTILFVPHVDESIDEDVPTFYFILNIHNDIL